MKASKIYVNQRYGNKSDQVLNYQDKIDKDKIDQDQSDQNHSD